jgi:hypothetical protein
MKLLTEYLEHALTFERLGGAGGGSQAQGGARGAGNGVS